MKKVKKFILQDFRNAKTLSPDFADTNPYPDGYLKEVSLLLKDCAELVEIREA
jgi:hypothetical protein